MMRIALHCVAFVAFLACSPAFADAQAADPFAGTWVLNIEQSSYPLGACPESMVIEIEAFDNVVRYRSTTVYSNGATSRAQYTAKYDGKEALVQGSRGLLLPVAMKRLDANTVVAAYKRGLKVVATSRREVSSDGRTMTITTSSPDKDGNSVTTIGVYHKTPS
jgi:hypothetical protein